MLYNEQQHQCYQRKVRGFPGRRKNGKRFGSDCGDSGIAAGFKLHQDCAGGKMLRD